MPFIFLLLLLLNTPFYAEINTLAVVGESPVTSFDVEEMRNFTEATSGKKPSVNEALETLLYNTSLLAIAEEQPDLVMNENEIRRTLATITNPTAQAGGEQRAQIYKKYPEIFRMMMRVDKARQGIIYIDPIIRSNVTSPSSEKEQRAFYNKNKDQMKDAPFPKINLIIFAVETDEKTSLSKLTEIETQLDALAKDLNKSSDFIALRKKYSSLKFTKYSGESGLYTPDIHVLQKGIPEEIVGASLQKTLPLGAVTLTISKNKGIFIPIPIPVRLTKKATYVTFKILDLVQPRMLSFEEAAPRIDERLRQERADSLVRELVMERIAQQQVTITVLKAGKFRSTIDKFLSGAKIRKDNKK